MTGAARRTGWAEPRCEGPVRTTYAQGAVLRPGKGVRAHAAAEQRGLVGRGAGRGRGSGRRPPARMRAARAPARGSRRPALLSGATRLPPARLAAEAAHMGRRVRREGGSAAGAAVRRLRRNGRRGGRRTARRAAGCPRAAQSPHALAAYTTGCRGGLRAALGAAGGRERGRRGGCGGEAAAAGGGGAGGSRRAAACVRAHVATRRRASAGLDCPCSQMTVCCGGGARGGEEVRRQPRVRSGRRGAGRPRPPGGRRWTRRWWRSAGWRSTGHATQGTLCTYTARGGVCGALSPSARIPCREKRAGHGELALELRMSIGDPLRQSPSQSISIEVAHAAGPAALEWRGAVHLQRCATVLC